MTYQDYMLRYEQNMARKCYSEATQSIDLAIGCCTCRYALVTIANERLYMERMIKEAETEKAADSLKGLILAIWTWLKGKKVTT